MKRMLIGILGFCIAVLGLIAVSSGVAQANRTSCSSATVNIVSSGVTDCFINSPGFTDYVHLPNTTSLRMGNSQTGYIRIDYFRCADYTRQSCGTYYTGLTIPCCGGYFTAQQIGGVPQVDIEAIHYSQVRT